MSDEQGREGQRDWGGDTAALGGYGSAGLFSRRRQMERTQGGSYANLSNVSRATAPGGYVSMPTTGPQPEVTTPFFGKRQGPSGPSAMAPGVAGNYNVRPPQVPNWGQTARLLPGIIGAAALLRKEPEESGTTLYRDRPAPEGPPAEGPPPSQLALPSGGRPMGTGEEGPRALEAGDVPVAALPRGGRARRRNRLAVPEPGVTSSWDPTLVAPRSPQGPPVRELTEGTPVPPYTSVTRATTRRTGRSTIGTESEPRVMGPMSGVVIDVEVKEAATGYEYPDMPTNTYLGQSPGRRATRGERNARKNQQQGQIPGFGWEEV